LDNWREILLDDDASIGQAIRILELTDKKIVFVVNEAKKILGTITDGDIRRALLSGINTSAVVTECLNRNPVVAFEKDSIEKINILFENKNISIVPILNDEYQITRIILREDLTTVVAEKDAVIVIMAGGVGKRLRPFTEGCPKPLIKVADKPIIVRIIEHAKNHGFTKFIISLGYLGDMLEEYLRDGSDYGVTISYVRDKKPLGTVGALSQIENLVQGDLVVVNGDIISNINYSELLKFHKSENADATMVVRPYVTSIPYGVPELRGSQIISLKEKPNFSCFINTGIYVLRSKVLEFLISGEYEDMPSLFEKLIARSKAITAFEHHGDWIDVGNSSDLIIATEKYANKNLSGE
jgi:dTDP-glucose pyrophosphorylase